MAEQPFPILAGVYKDRSPLDVEGHCTDSSGMRPKGNSWETQGGRQDLLDETFTGIARGAAVWSDENGSPVAAFGTQAKLYAYYGGELIDITPKKAKGTLVNPFTTEAGSPTIYVAHATHGLKVGDTPTFSNGDAVGGLTLNGTYTVTRVISINAYEFDAGSNAGSGVTGGGKVEYECPLDEGLVDGAGGIGYGSGVYDEGTYGRSTVSADFNPRVTTVAPWGSNGLACFSNGAVFEYQPLSSYAEVVVDGDYAAATNWTTGTGFSIGSGVATAVAGSESRLTQDSNGYMDGGLAYELVVTVTVTAGSLSFVVDSDPTGSSPTEYVFGESMEKSATYTRRFTAPPSPTDFGFKKDASFAGTIDNVSIKPVQEAYRITSAPPYCGGVTVDANKIAIVWATVQQDGVYNRKCIRWSDVGDNTTWLSDASNLAGENSDFGSATEIKRVLPTAGYNVIFTNDRIFAMTFTGNVGDAYRFNEIMGGAGLIGTLACAEISGRVFFMGSDRQFYIIQGGVAQVINCEVRRDLDDNLPDAQVEKIVCVVNSTHNEVRWSYPDKRDGADGVDNDEISRSVVYNYVLDLWYVETSEKHTTRLAKGAFSQELSMGTDNKLYFTDFGNDDSGDVLTTSLTTGHYDLADGHQFINITRFIPNFDDQVGNITLTFFYQMRTNGPWYSKQKTITPTTEKLDVDIECKRFYLKFETSAAGTFYRIGALRMDINGIASTQ